MVKTPELSGVFKIIKRNSYLEKENRRLNNKTMKEKILELDSDLSDFLECSICTRGYTVKRIRQVLTCGHICSNECFINWTKSASNNDINCPSCKRKNQVL